MEAISANVSTSRQKVRSQESGVRIQQPEISSQRWLHIQAVPERSTADRFLADRTIADRFTS
jgi:hypothetical protein